MCALTVHGNLPGKSFVLPEAEEELCRAFPVAVTQLLLFLLFCGRQRFSGAVKKKKEEEIQGFQNLFFMSCVAFRENCHGVTCFSETCRISF